MKFTHKFGESVFSVTYYQDKRLKSVKGLGRRLQNPLYLRVNFKKQTLHVRSILWKRLMEANNDFLCSVVWDKNEKERAIVELYANIELFTREKEFFEQLCRYEFECIKRIITFACQSQPATVKQITDAYQYWGQDGLREIASAILESILGYGVEKTSGAAVSFFRIQNLPTISETLRRFLQGAQQTTDPVTLVCIVDELNVVERLEIKGKLWEDYHSLVTLIGKLLLDTTSQMDKTYRDVRTSGVFYFPRIHFYFPPTNDLSRSTPAPGEYTAGLKAIDLLRFQSYIKKS